MVFICSFGKKKLLWTHHLQNLPLVSSQLMKCTICVFWEGWLNELWSIILICDSLVLTNLLQSSGTEIGNEKDRLLLATGFWLIFEAKGVCVPARIGKLSLEVGPLAFQEWDKVVIKEALGLDDHSGVRMAGQQAKSNTRSHSAMPSHMFKLRRATYFLCSQPLRDSKQCWEKR